ncbi:MAG TPA: hypothetical protein VKQ32_25215 [Polyangia bacterium]|nr:hypothetical protein [Polyangia bacterium]
MAYLVASPYFERLNNPNENVRVWATRAVVSHHVLRIDEIEREWGWVNDKAKNDQHVFSSKAPGASLVGVPVLWVQTKLRQLVGWPPPGKRETTFWLRLIVVKLPMCLFLFLFARYAERVTGSAWARDAAVIALGLGTLLYPYGNLFVGHALAAATAFSAFILIDEAGPDDDRNDPGVAIDARRLLAAGLLAGLTVIFEYQAALVSVALAVYVAVRYRRRPSSTALFVAGAVPPAVALGAYHTALFGRPWEFPLAHVENPVFARTAHAAGFHGLSVPQPAAFPAFLLSPSYGLFAFSPVLLLGVAGVVALFLRRSRSARRDAALVTAICVLMFLFLAGMSNWRAGWCVGPRYIATVAPFLMLPMLKSWTRVGGRWWLTALAVGLLIPSVVLNVVSGALYPHYPESFDNPVFDLAFPLIGEGYAPYGLGWLLHLPGRWSLAPLALVVAAALALIAAGDDPRPRRTAAHLSLAVAVAAVFLIGLGAYGRKPSAAEAHAAAVVRQAWDPPRR